jgi:hypothetical protein
MPIRKVIAAQTLRFRGCTLELVTRGLVLAFVRPVGMVTFLDALALAHVNFRPFGAIRFGWMVPGLKPGRNPGLSQAAHSASGQKHPTLPFT